MAPSNAAIDQLQKRKEEFQAEHPSLREVLLVKRTVKEHLDWLKGRLETLNNQFMESAGREKANRFQTEIRAIERKRTLVTVWTEV